SQPPRHRERASGGRRGRSPKGGAVKTIATSIAVAAVGGVLLVLEALFEPSRVALAWHAAATFGMTLALGGFFVGAVLVNAGAKWSATLRHVHCAIGGALPVACLA